MEECDDSLECDIANFKTYGETEASILEIGEDEQNKTLGVFWNSCNDLIQYRVDFEILSNCRITKRGVLSTICQIFDPLGLVSCIIIVAKLMIQQMWIRKLEWDDELPNDLRDNWIRFREDLKCITELSIPRRAVLSEYIRIEIHGFSDASEKAYAACVYIRCTFKIPEQRSTLSLVSCIEKNDFLTLIEKFSSLNKIVKVTCFVNRLVFNCRKGERKFGVFTPIELEKSLNYLIALVQETCFSVEYKALLCKKELNGKSKLLSLRPFLDNGVMRVGGRLRNAKQQFDKRHPIILPKGHALTDLILRDYNEKLLHCGVQMLLCANSEKIGEQLAHERVHWHFIPARSPSFGGLWEAGIKSVKHHFKRVIGTQHLTFEEISTVLTQIESILNSRPLCPLTEDPEDAAALTPAHFLIGRQLTALPELDVSQVAVNRLNTWQQLQAMTQHYWKRWSKEYLAELQTRTKWKRDGGRLLEIGSLVLLKEENTPTLDWRLGRVVRLFPGQDGIVRVCEIKVRGTIVKRAINRLCILPVETHNNF
nr:unnamed protein product [Callosobruchus analis]